MRWNVQLVNEVKEEVRRSLLDCNDPLARLNTIYQKIHKLSHDSDGKAQLYCLVHIMSALVHHEKHGGIQRSKLRQLYDHANQILQIQNINPKRSKLAFLFYELYSVISQISRKEGEHWSATWNLLLTKQYQSTLSDGQEARRILGLALRILRLGDAPHALTLYQSLGTLNHHPSIGMRARIGEVRCIRLMGNHQHALDLICCSVETLDLDENLRNEFLFEQIICECAMHNDFSVMVGAVKPRKGSHYESIYILEAYLWANALSTTRWQSKVPKPSSIVRNPALNTRAQGAFFKSASIIEQCLDVDYPVEHRVRTLGYMLDTVNEVLTIDKELLLWAVASRLLIRLKAFELASVCLNQYQQMSRRLSGGTNDDVLKICSDMLSRQWLMAS